jgi:purine-binding chemotaxis protein CheW
MNLKQLQHDPAARSVLEARAQVLARKEQVQDSSIGEEILIFQVGQGRYGLPANSVREVHPLGDWTALPGTPPFVVGLVNLRGQLFSAIDLRPLLDLPPAPPAPGARLLIVSVAATEIALLADHVVEVRPGNGNLSQAISVASGQARAWVKGIDSRLTLLLDPALLLADPALVVDDPSL